MAETQKDYPIKHYESELNFEGDLGGSVISNGNLSNPKGGKSINGVAIKGTNSPKFA